MPDTAPVIEQPRSNKFPGMSAAADEAGELGKLWSVTPTTPEPSKTTTTTVVTQANVTAAPAPAAQPTEPTAEDDEKFLTSADMPRKPDDWQKRRDAEGRRLKRKDEAIAKLTKDLEDAKKVQPMAKLEEDQRWKDLSQREADLSERLRLHDITNHPKFKAFYEGKANEQITMAKAIVGAENADRAAQILGMADGEYRNQQIDELMGNLSPAQQSRLGGVINRLYEINADRSSQIETAKKDFERMQTDEKSRLETETKTRQERADKLFTDTLKTFTEGDKALEVFQTKAGDDDATKAHNQAVNDRVAYAKGLLYTENDPSKLMHAALSAAAVPGLVKGYQGALARITELEAQVKTLTAAQPSLQAQRQKAAGAAQEKQTQQVNGKRGMIRNNLQDAADWQKETFADSDAGGA